MHFKGLVGGLGVWPETVRSLDSVALSTMFLQFLDGDTAAPWDQLMRTDNSAHDTDQNSCGAGRRPSQC